MKKVMFFMALTAAVVFSSCSKGPKYQVSNQSDYTFYDCIVFEYSGDDIVGQTNVGTISANSLSQMIESAEHTEKVKVSLCFFTGGDRYYTTQFFYLKKGKKSVVEINNDTMVSLNMKQSEKDSGSTPIGKLLF